MNAAKRAEIFRRLHEDNPEPRTELAYTTPFELLIAVILSAQATDVGVNKATAASIRWPTPRGDPRPRRRGAVGVHQDHRPLQQQGEERHRNLPHPHRKARRPGPRQPRGPRSPARVGRKTANVVLNTAFRQLAMAVDTHIFRVANRTGIAPGKNVLEVEKKLLKFVPREYLLDAHHWLILHGRYVCKARKPQCGSCRIEDLCEYKHKTSDD